MEVKLCKGPLHPPGGVYVPLSEFTYNQSGPREGKPLSRCRECRSSGNPKTIPSSVFMPLMDILFEDRDYKQVTKMTGLNGQLLRDLLEGKRKKIYKNTFLSLKRAVDNIPKEKVSIGPQSQKTKRNGHGKLSYEERLALKRLISVAQKDRYKKDKQLLKHVV